MFKILSKQQIAINIKRIEVTAGHIVQKIKPGQFVVAIPEDGGGHAPLSVVEVDRQREVVSLVFEERGAVTQRLGELKINDSIFQILGPRGMPSRIEKTGTIIAVASGVGAAQLLLICRAYRNAGNKVIGIIGAKTKRSLILETQMRLACQELHITTEDGTFEKRGFVLDTLNEVLRHQKCDLIYSCGPLDLIRAIADITREKKIRNLTYLFHVPIIDGMGLCGACRLKIDGKDVLACVDGPEFDAHKIDFNDLSLRV